MPTVGRPTKSLPGYSASVNGPVGFAKCMGGVPYSMELQQLEGSSNQIA